MLITRDQKLIDSIQRDAIPLESGDSIGQLLNEIGDASVVLIGEATHGTHDFYHLRAEITKRLIIEKGFSAIAIEGDWPDVYQAHRYVQNKPENAQLNPLEKFKRFPEWVWRNMEVMNFLYWLRSYNILYANDKFPVGFYGLDLYSLTNSINEVLDYLEVIDPEEAKKARQRYSCFDLCHMDLHQYGYKVNISPDRSCEEAVMAQWTSFNKRRDLYLSQDGNVALEEYFNAWQNVNLIANAEAYYRAMYYPGVGAWNLRDQHMFKVLQEISLYLKQRLQRPAKIIVWAHNSHVGNAGATELVAVGQTNLGELVKKHYGQQSFLLGFSTYQGEVAAASEWDAPMEKMEINPALPGSYENLFHQVEYRNFLLSWSQGSRMADLLSTMGPHLHRAIGVIYRPDKERYSHYYYSHLRQQFDAIIHLDETSAVHTFS
jgi:erythromycin esterase-like protein